MTRPSSSSVSPRPIVSRERSSAPAMKAIRSRRLSALRRLALPVGWRCGWFMRAFSPFVDHKTTVLVQPSVEPNGDPPLAEVGDEVPRAHLFEVPSEVGHVGRQGRDLDAPLRTRQKET